MTITVNGRSYAWPTTPLVVVCVDASIHNHINQDRHLNRRDIFKQNRAAALADWRQLIA